MSERIRAVCEGFMRKSCVLKAVAFLCLSFPSFSQTNFTWSATAASSNWNTSANWSPNGTPLSTDNVVIVNSANIPVLPGNSSVNNFTMTSGSIDLGANTLTINGTAIFTAGTLNNGTIAPSGSAVTCTASTFNTTVNAVCAAVTLNGGTFNAVTTIEKTGASNNTGNGGCTFNAATNIINSGTTILRMANTTADIYNQNVTFTNTGSSYIDVGYGAGTTQLNGDVYVNSTSGTGVRFGQGSGLVNLASGKTVNVGGTGFSAGALYFRNFTQTGSTAQSLDFTGTAILYFQSGSTFNANISMVAPQIYLNGTTFNGTVSLEKNGATNNAGTGGNAFNAATTLALSGSGYFMTGNGNADVFSAPLTLNNTGTAIIHIAYATATATISDNIVVTSASSGGVAFGSNGGAVNFASGKTITVGGAGFSGSGTLLLKNFTQNGSTAQTLTLTGTSVLTIGSGSTFNGNVNFISPQIYLNGCTYNGTVTMEKTGATNNACTGNNTFNGVVSFINSGSGNLRLANTNGDVFNQTLTLTNIGRSYIDIAYGAVAGSSLNENVIVNSTGGTGIRFGQGAGTVTLAAGKTVTVGGTGYSAGDLKFRNFTQTGATAQSFTLTGTAIIYFETGATFNGAVTALAPQIYLNGTTFNGTTYIEKTGATGNTGLGGNTFNGVTILKNSGTANMISGNTTADTYNNDLTLTAANTGSIYLAYVSAGTVFNGNIVVNSASSGAIYLGNGASCSSTLASGKTVTIGGSGFSGSGVLQFKNFTQTGATAQALTLTGTSTLSLLAGNTFNGNVTFIAPQVLLSGTTYNGTVSIEKNGATNNAGVGGNTFNNTTSLTLSGSGYFMSGNGNADAFNGVLTVTNAGTANIHLAYATAPASFNENIVVNATNIGGIYFGNNGGSSTLASGKTITIGGSGFSSSALLVLKNFTQTGSTAQSLTLTGTATLTIGAGTTFNGNVDFTAPIILINGCTYNGTAAFNRTGAGTNQSSGGNTFNAAVAFTNSGSGIFYIDYTGSDVFNDNIIVNSTGGSDVRFGASTGSATLAAGKTIAIGTGGFTSGGLYLKNFTQTGSAAQSLTLTGTAALYFQTGSTFNGNLIAVSPQVYLNGSTFNGTTTIEKNGATNNAGAGGNTFNGTTTLTCSSNGYFMTGNGTADVFSDLTATSTGTGILYVAYATGSSSFNGNIVVSSSNTAGVYFGSTSGTSTLASGKTITVGSGFSSGILLLKGITQSGSTAQSITLTGTATLTVGSGATFNADVTFTAPQILLNGCTFNGTATIEKSGATNNASTGSNVFNSTTTIKNSGSGILYLGNTSGDDFNGNVTFIQTGAGALYPAYNSTSTFSGNISTTGTSTAITFASAATGRVNIDGGTQSISGSSAQTLIIKRLTVSGGGTLTLNVPVNISTGGDLSMTSGTVVTTSTNILTLQDESITSTIGNSGSYVNGPLAYTMSNNGASVLYFPLGKGSDWRPIALTPTHNAATAYTYTAERFNASADAFGYTLPASVDKVSTYSYWDISRTASSSANLTSAVVTFYYGSSGTSDHVLDYTGLTLCKSNGAGAWIDIVGTATANNDGSISSGAFTSFSKFTLANLVGSGNPLPVELLDFTAVLNKGKVDLNWSTATEINNDYFTLERSADGKEFTALSQISGAGNSHSLLKYSFVDENPLQGLSYYRLKQTDFNGAFTYSKVQLVNQNAAPSILAYSIVSDEIHLQLTGYSANEKVSVVIYDLSGREIYSSSLILDAKGNNNMNIANDFAQGIYSLNVISAQQALTQKLALR